MRVRLASPYFSSCSSSHLNSLRLLLVSTGVQINCMRAPFPYAIRLCHQVLLNSCTASCPILLTRLASSATAGPRLTSLRRITPSWVLYLPVLSSTLCSCSRLSLLLVLQRFWDSLPEESEPGRKHG